MLSFPLDVSSDYKSTYCINRYKQSTFRGRCVNTMEPALLRRNQIQGRYDLEAVASVFKDSFIAHVSYVEEGFPQCLPMIALLHTIDDQTAVYLHGHPGTKLMELVREKMKEEDSLEKIKVCITATTGKSDSHIMPLARSNMEQWMAWFYPRPPTVIP